jgi:hypothetical protein
MKPFRYLLIGVATLLLASAGWRHRNDAWVQDLLRPSLPASASIRFDNGSFKDGQAQIMHSPTNDSALNTVGKLKKCTSPRGVVYTDQICPSGSKPAPVNGGNVTVVDSGTTKTETAQSKTDAPKALRDALDLSGNDNLREKMMERAVGK